jgi:hypothetical protein
MQYSAAMRVFKFALAAALLNTVAVAQREKTPVCHFPPDNPDNAHTLYLPAPAIPDHVAHGDVAGFTCEELGPSNTSLGTLALLTAGWAAWKWRRRSRQA